MVLREQCLNGIQEIYENSFLQPPFWLGIEQMTRFLEHFHYSYWRTVNDLSIEEESKLKNDLYGSIKRLLQNEQVQLIPLSLVKTLAEHFGLFDKGVRPSILKAIET